MRRLAVILCVLGSVVAVASCRDDNPSCGDGKAEGTEACDDGNDIDNDACTNICTVRACGDRIVQSGEECDDGNGIDYDMCTNLCRLPRCGDGILQGEEACDDGNEEDGDACVSCAASRCGDGFVRIGVEACDDGNDLDSDSCRNNCRLPICGDGVVQSGEACDDGNLDDTDACLNTCQSARCGDGFMLDGVEACDDGNRDNTDVCLDDCTIAACGDGFVRIGVEACDDGNDLDSDSCRNDCRLPTCGDGFLQAGEECDDGNLDGSDACLNTCMSAHCGDSFLRDGVETCDDGNHDNTDGCLDNCSLAACGDGFVRTGVEACDDGNDMDADACRNDCRLPTCGDGFVQSGEACDDGNRDDTDACLNTCLSAHCGDSFLHDGVEACDDGNSDNVDACLDDCTLAACGDGFVRTGVEACDDGNAVDADACRNDCTLAACGDLILQSGEECDDGNRDDSDDCVSSCLAARCGDGFLRKGVEACDDGNADDLDACRNDCTLPLCGDGIAQIGEACDDGNSVDTDGCLGDCRIARCGDGQIQGGGEECDDGNTFPGDACTSDCRFARCGDGIPWVAVEPCDDGNSVDTDACRNDCSLPFCGDGVVRAGVEDCDDRNVDNTDGCLMDCTRYDWCEPLAVTTVSPLVVCQGTSQKSILIEGNGFVIIQGQEPVVTVDGIAGAVEVGFQDCVPLDGVFVDAQACGAVQIRLPDGTGNLAVGEYIIRIELPVSQGCVVQAIFSVATPPVLDRVDPFQTCASGGRFTVTAANLGSGFVPGAWIVIRPSGGAPGFLPVQTEWTDDQHVVGTLDDTFAPGLHDVTVENGAGCQAAPLLKALNLIAQPFVFFADPPVLYNGIDLTVTVYASGVNGNVQSVMAVPTAGGQGVLLPITNQSRPDRVQVLAAAGALMAGTYDIVLTDSICSNVLAGGLTVAAVPTVSVAAILPPFGWSEAHIPVEVTSLSPAPIGMVNFRSTPRVYLSPRSIGGVATEIRALTFLDTVRLSGSVPTGMPVDSYNLVVVNPDGTVGVLADAFKILADPPPLIVQLSPGSVPSQNDVSVTIRGSGFEVDAAVAARCRWYDSVGDVLNGTLDADVTFIDNTTLGTVWDFMAAGIPNNAVCVLRATNVEDATWADYSALSVTPASNTPNDFRTSNMLNVGRRALAGAAVRMNAIDRFVFAIGGDNGLAGASLQAFSSVESARVDPYGLIEPWVVQRNSLPEPRSFITAAMVGRFTYLPGGRTGATQTTSVLRAYLLDPREAPQITTLDLALSDLAGLGAGRWIYRVSATLDAADPANPNGEGLAGEPVTLLIPAIEGRKVQLTLFWEAVSNARSYRIYRTSNVNSAAGEERLLAEVPAGLGTPFFTDAGVVDIDVAAPAPLALGSLGSWNQVGSLQVAREGAAVVAVPDPNVPGRTYLQILGGLSAGAVLASAERATIVESAANRQSLSGFTLTDGVLPVARWQTAAAYVDHELASIVPATDAWIYLFPGLSATAVGVSKVTAFKLDTVDGVGNDDGRLGSGIELDSPTAPAGGFGALARNGFLYMLAGAGTADSAGKAAQICTSSGGNCSGGAPEPPDLVMWNAGIQMTEGRLLNGTASESGFIFLLGGGTTSSPATRTTESTNI
jgi:cysteine-rich repeat protein